MEVEFAGRIAAISEKDVGSFFCVRASTDKIFGIVTVPTIAGKGYASFLLNSRFPKKPERTNLHGHIDRPALIFGSVIMVPDYGSMEWWSSAGIPDGALILAGQDFMICSDDGEDTSYISVRDGSYSDNISRDVVYFKKWSIFVKDRRDSDKPLFSMDCDNRE